MGAGTLVGHREIERRCLCLGRMGEDATARFRRVVDRASSSVLTSDARPLHPPGTATVRRVNPRPFTRAEASLREAKQQWRPRPQSACSYLFAARRHRPGRRTRRRPGPLQATVIERDHRLLSPRDSTHPGRALRTPAPSPTQSRARRHRQRQMRSSAASGPLPLPASKPANTSDVAARSELRDRSGAGGATAPRYGGASVMPALKQSPRRGCARCRRRGAGRCAPASRDRRPHVRHGRRPLLS
jgi:hypothetical protein